MSNNLHIGDLLDVAYGIAKSNFSDKEFNFSSLWSKTWKTAQNFKKEKVEDWIGIFYTELLLDPRFVTYSNNTWRLKEFLDYSDFMKKNNMVFSDDFVLDEDSEPLPAASVKPQVEEKATSEDEGEVDENLEQLIDSEI